MGQENNAQQFLNRRQALERRKLELYGHPALTDRADLLHDSVVEEMNSIQRELSELAKT